MNTLFILNKTPTLRKHTSLTRSMINPLTGVDVGIPLNINQNIFTNLHYGFDITTTKIVALQFMLGFYTYGKDRLKDALEYEIAPFSTSKEELYKYMLQHKTTYQTAYHTTALLIISMLIYEVQLKSIPMILVLSSSEYYKELKQRYPFAKPFYIAFMWTFSSVVLPCLLYDHDYTVLLDPLDYLPCALTLFATSNYADISDIEEDNAHGIFTIPVTYGIVKTTYIVLFTLFLSSLLFGLNDHYLTRPFVNSLFELQNAGLSFIAYNLTRAD